MLRGSVAIVALVVAGAGREVEGACDLLVKERILHRGGDVRVEADGELAHIARALVDVELLVDARGVVGRGLDDLPVAEHEADAGIGKAVLQRGRVVADHAVDALAHGRGVHLAVGDVQPARALDRGHPLDGEGEVRAGRDDAHAVRALHQRHERIHRPVHFGIVEAADVEEEILERLGAHIRHLRHGGRRVAQDDPLGLRHADIAVHRLPVFGHVPVHALGGHVGQLAAVAAAAHADVRVHLGHDRAVPRGAQAQLLRGAAKQQLALEGLVRQPEERHAARGVDLLDQRARQVVVAADGLDEDLFARLEIARERHQPVRELPDAGIKHLQHLRVNAIPVLSHRWRKKSSPGGRGGALRRGARRCGSTPRWRPR